MTKIAVSGPAVVRNINIHAGLYRVLGTDGMTWYQADVKEGTCSCPAGQHGFVNCKRDGQCRHLRAARIAAKAWHDMRFGPRPLPVVAA